MYSPEVSIDPNVRQRFLTEREWLSRGQRHMITHPEGRAFGATIPRLLQGVKLAMAALIDRDGFR